MDGGGYARSIGVIGSAERDEIPAHGGLGEMLYVAERERGEALRLRSREVAMRLLAGHGGRGDAVCAKGVGLRCGGMDDV